MKAGAPYLTRGIKIGRMASALSRAHASRARAGTPRGLDATAPSGVAREGPSGPIGPEWPEWPEWPERARVARVGPASRARIGTPRGLDAFATSGCIIYTQRHEATYYGCKILGQKNSGPRGPEWAEWARVARAARTRKAPRAKKEPKPLDPRPTPTHKAYTQNVTTACC